MCSSKRWPGFEIMKRQINQIKVVLTVSVSMMNCKHCDIVTHKLHIQAKQKAPVIINQQCFSSASCSITLEETSNATRSHNF